MRSHPRIARSSSIACWEQRRPWRPLKATLVGRTGGNPFFLEESVRTLVETDVLTGDRGAYGLSRLAGDIRVPATVQAVLAARVERLFPRTRPSCKPQPSSARTCHSRLLQAIAETVGRRASPQPQQSPGRRVPRTRVGSSQTWVHVQHALDPGGRISKPLGATAMRSSRPGSLKRSKPRFPTRLTETWSGSPITPSRANSGRRH